MYVIYNTSIRCWYFRAISARPPRKLRIYSPSCDDDIKSDSTLSTVYYKYQLLHLLIHLEHPINQVYDKKKLSQLSILDEWSIRWNRSFFSASPPSRRFSCFSVRVPVYSSLCPPAPFGSVFACVVLCASVCRVTLSARRALNATQEYKRPPFPSAGKRAAWFHLSCHLELSFSHSCDKEMNSFQHILGCNYTSE